MTRIRFPACAVLAFLASGCMVGKDSVLFVTNTSVAADLDSLPPTASLAYGRTEMVLEPTFEENRVLPVLSSVGTSNGLLSFGSNHSFATGDAALVFADKLTDANDYVFPGRLGIPVPEAGTRAGVITTKIRPEDRRRIYFGTQTNLGLAVTWTEAMVPDSINLGFKRKEVAYVPLIETVKTEGNVKTREVRLTSLLATADVGTHVGGISDTGMHVGQLFATGEAATLLAAHGPVRQVLGASIVPNYEEAVALRASLDEGGHRALAALTFMTLVYDEIENRAKAGESEAVALKGRLDLLGTAVDQFEVTTYAEVPNKGLVPQDKSGDPIGGTGFRRILDYRSTLEASAEAVRNARPVTTVDFDPHPLGATRDERFQGVLAAQEAAIRRLDTAWAKDRNLIDAIDYYNHLMTGR